MPANSDAHAPVLSIVLANWNVRDFLRGCLRSVEEQMRMPREDWEVIVVDNGSTDGSVEMLQEEFPRTVLIRNDTNVGFGRANNQALPHCKGRYILLLNTDTVILDHALDTMVEHMERHPEIGALGCRLVNPDGSFQRGCAGGAFMNLGNVAAHQLFLDRLLPSALLPAKLFLEGDPQGDLEVEWVHAACMLLRREALGGTLFDEAFFLYGEDMALCERLGKAGWKVVYTSSATVLHYGHKSTGQSPVYELNVLNGMRTYFSQRHGRFRIWLYDLLVVTGFGVRWLGMRAASLLRPGRGYAERAAGRRRSFGFALRLMLGLRTPAAQ